MSYCMFLGNNFEDIEAITVIDILRRAGVKLDLYGVGGDSITSRSGVLYTTEKTFLQEKDVDPAVYDGLLLPGGPGVDALTTNQDLINVIKTFHSQGKLVFAICAAPRLLDVAGILAEKKYTCFPSTPVSAGTMVNQDVVVDGNVITSRGPGTAFQAALKLVELIVSPEEASRQAQKTLYKAVP